MVDLRVTHSPDTRRCTSTGTARRQRLNPSGTLTRPLTIKPPLRSVTLSNEIVIRRSCLRFSPSDVGEVDGWPEPGPADGQSLGDGDGSPEGDPDGLAEGEPEGLPEGEADGVAVGLPEGEPLGEGDDPPPHPISGRQSSPVGEGEGEALGVGLGVGLGCCWLMRAGAGLGEPGGLPLGLSDGDPEGVGDAVGEGEPLGDAEGEPDGDPLGDGDSQPTNGGHSGRTPPSSSVGHGLGLP